MDECSSFCTENFSLPDLGYNNIAAKHLDKDLFDHLHDDSEEEKQVCSGSILSPARIDLLETLPLHNFNF